MSLQLVLSIVALIFAVIGGIWGRGSTPMILLAVAVTLVALVQVMVGGLVMR